MSQRPRLWLKWMLWTSHIIPDIATGPFSAKNQPARAPTPSRDPWAIFSETMCPPNASKWPWCWDLDQAVNDKVRRSWHRVLSVAQMCFANFLACLRRIVCAFSTEGDISFYSMVLEVTASNVPPPLTVRQEGFSKAEAQVWGRVLVAQRADCPQELRLELETMGFYSKFYFDASCACWLTSGSASDVCRSAWAPGG